MPGSSDDESGYYETAGNNLLAKRWRTICHLTDYSY